MSQEIDEAIIVLGSCCGDCEWYCTRLIPEESHSPIEICNISNPQKKFISKFDTCSNFSRS